MKKTHTTADTILEISFGLLTLFSLLVSPIYQTFSFSLPILTLLLVAYYTSKWTLPQSSLYQYVGSACLALYTALLIYQMHGMIEMHFIAFIGSILLINYKKWQLQLPLTLLVVVHHSVLAYIQFLGYKEVYFTAEDYMNLQTFVIHVLLAAIIFFLCGLWAYQLNKTEKVLEAKNLLLETQMETTNLNIDIANQIANGNLNNQIVANEKDELGKALILMQKNLVVAKKREEEEKYMNLGLAQAGEILGRMNDNIEELNFEMLKFVVKYMGANQGIVFLLNDQDKDEIFLEVSACYAYDRKKFMQKKVYPQEGLVGTAYIEKEIIYLTEVPEDYINITSGLGHASPNAIVIVPLIYNDIVYAVIELAFFNELETYQIQFLKKVGENMASTIATVKINEHTKELLAISQQKSEELLAQEEEMRQNMEEMKSIQETITINQEELKRAERRNKQILENSPMGIVSVSERGDLLYTNGVANKMLNMAEDEQRPNYSEVFKVLKLEKLVVGDTKRTKIFPLHGLTPFMGELVISKLDNDFLLFFKDVTEAIRKENELIMALEQAEKLKKAS